MSVHENVAMNENTGKESVSLIIWPKFNGKYEYGVSLSVNVDSEDGEFTFKTYGFMFDENMNSLEELNESEKKVLEENKDLIQDLYNRVYDMWEIGGKK